MPNFAQQYPLLLFIPLLVFAVLALVVGIIHVAILIETRVKAGVRATGAAARQTIPAIIPAASRVIEPHLPRSAHAQQPNLRLVSTRP